MGKLNDLFFDIKLTCNACGRENQEGYFCKDCQEIIQYNNVICNHCGRSVINSEQFCNSCQGRETYFDKARSVFRYESPIAEMLKGFKYSNKRYLAKVFADICSYLIVKDFADLDFIINVPMHVKDKKKRGYNQTELLCNELVLATGYKFEKGLFTKQKRTVKQVTLSREDRLKNLQDAFVLTDKKAVKDKVVLVVDDCMTTGATVEAISQKLKKAKAKKVYVLTVASVGERELNNRKKKKLSIFAKFLQKMGLHKGKNVVK